MEANEKVGGRLLGYKRTKNSRANSWKRSQKILITVPSRRFTLSMAAISPSTPPQTRSPHEYVSLWICRKNQSKEKKSWHQQRRPPAPLSRLSHATPLCTSGPSLKMLGILAILQR